MKFTIRAKKREANAKVEQLTREADRPDQIVLQLQNEGYLILSVEEGGRKKGLFGFGASSSKPQKTESAKKSLGEITLFESVKGSELTSFFIQLIALLRAGVPILKSLSIIEQGLKTGLLKKVIHSTIDKISQGFSLSHSLANYPKVFPPFWLGLIEAGEASGTLPDVLEEIYKYQETSEKFKRKVTSAMVYPAILVCFSIGAVAIFMVKVIPTFENVFKGMGGGRKLPEVTQFVLNASRFMQHNFLFIILMIIVFVVAYTSMSRVKSSKKILDGVKLQIPLIKDFLLEIAIVRFCRGLSTMVKSGISILQALEISSRLVGNLVIEDRVMMAREDVKQGHSLAAPLAKYKVFPIFVTQLISVGEESGALEKFLDVISNFYEERVDATIQRIAVSIEPMIILFMGIVVGTLVISMFLPLINISTGSR